MHDRVPTVDHESELAEREEAWIPWAHAAMALVVVALSFATAGSALPGAIAATRNSARFSALVFAVALAARAERPRPLVRRRIQITLAFDAAHVVHYVTVI